jgi:hypothetical protein
MTKLKMLQTEFVDNIYKLGILDKIDINTWEQKTIEFEDGIYNWRITKNIWPYDNDGFCELHITQSNHDWVLSQKMNKRETTKAFCKNFCFVYKEEPGFPYRKKDTILKDGLAFQYICVKKKH